MLYLLIGMLLYWAWRSFRSWMADKPADEWEIEVNEEIPVTEAVGLLEEAGYEVMTMKRKVDVGITVNEDEELQSRLFIDHFARQDGKLFVVKLARERKPMDRTGSGIRDHLLVYALLFREAEGVLYVDPSRRSIQKIQFHIEG